MAVAGQDVGPAVVIEIEEAGAPTKKAGVAAQAGLEGHVFEVVVAQVAVKRGSVAGEIGFDDFESAIAEDIGGGNAHACLRFAVGAKSHARFQGDVGECAVVIVLEQRGWGGIVGDVDVGPAVVIEIADQNA